MKIVALFVSLLFLTLFAKAQTRNTQEPPPKFEVDAPANPAANKGEKSTKSRGKKSRYKAPRKVFPPSEKNKENPEAVKSLDEQIKDADRSDLEPE